MATPLKYNDIDFDPASSVAASAGPGNKVRLDAPATAAIRSYGRFTLTPANSSTVSAVGLYSASEFGAGLYVYNHLDAYAMTNLRVIELNSGGSEPAATATVAMAATPADIANNVNAVRTLTDRVEGHVFDFVDTAVPAVHSVFAMNGLLSRVKERRYYDTTSKVMSTGANIDADFVAMWNLCHPGFPLGAFTPEVFWLSTNRKSLYDFPKHDVGVVDLTSAGDRRTLLAGSIQPASVGVYNFGGKPAFIGFDTVNIAGLGVAYTNTEVRAIARSVRYEFGSWLVGIPLVSGTGERAVLIKPLGVDQIFINAFDPATTRLEAIGYARNQHRPRLAVPQLMGSAGVGTAGPYHVSALGAATGLPASGVPNSGNAWGVGARIQFQMRDLTRQGYVSPVAGTEILCLRRQGYIPERFVQRPVSG